MPILQALTLFAQDYSRLAARACRYLVRKTVGDCAGIFAEQGLLNLFSGETRVYFASLEHVTSTLSTILSY